VLESVLRNCDGKKVSETNVKELANWKPNETRTAEIPFVVAHRVAGFHRRAAARGFGGDAQRGAKLGKNPKIIERSCRWILVVDHSVQVDFAGAADSMQRNLDLEFTRNASAINFSNGACRRLTRSKSFRRESELFTK